MLCKKVLHRADKPGRNRGYDALKIMSKNYLNCHNCYILVYKLNKILFKDKIFLFILREVGTTDSARDRIGKAFIQFQCTASRITQCISRKAQVFIYCTCGRTFDILSSLYRK